MGGSPEEMPAPPWEIGMVAATGTFGNRLRLELEIDDLEDDLVKLTGRNPSYLSPFNPVATRRSRDPCTK